MKKVTEASLMLFGFVLSYSTTVSVWRNITGAVLTWDQEQERVFICSLGGMAFLLSAMIFRYLADPQSPTVRTNLYIGIGCLAIAAAALWEMYVHIPYQGVMFMGFALCVTHTAQAQRRITEDSAPLQELLGICMGTLTMLMGSVLFLARFL